MPFLPVSKKDMHRLGWDYYDFLVITGDAYVDHPSFGAAVISRTLEAQGYRVCVLAQPGWHNLEAFRAIGAPRLAVFIGAGNLDSMVAHYTAAKKRRSEDFYSPGCKRGLRPDRATNVYTKCVREAYGDIPIIIGGLEASLRRFAHYDYWDDAVRPSVLPDSGADLLVYGMGERATIEIADRLALGEDISRITDVRGTAFMTNNPKICRYDRVECASFKTVCRDKVEHTKAVVLQYREHDAVRGRAVVQEHENGQFLVVNPPQKPLSTAEFDEISAYPYMRTWHPMYEKSGGVPAIEEVRFSVIHNRGCFGACNFCALAFHQGRTITSRSHESVIAEVEGFTKDPDFKGYVHDVGGPTANFRHPSCKKQLEHGVCPNRQCLVPTPCKNLDADHSDYLSLLRKLRAIPGVKKVFVRSGIRFDYMLCDKNGKFFSELVENHISGQLKVAPEHCIDSVLGFMGKPGIATYEKFRQKYESMNRRHSKEQYLVPYLMSSHPGCTLQNAVELAEYLNRTGRQPEQVQDFYPTPGTLSTCMYFTGLDYRTLKPIYVARTPEEKAFQRALLQWKRPEKRQLIIKALKAAGREDLIGFHKGALVKPYERKPRNDEKTPARGSAGKQTAKQPAKKGMQTSRNSPAKKSAQPKNQKNQKKKH
ncbi:MAG: YgiQ family radical SAM protein [Oscillospiraceae bacterium]|nr:YgiQ family radical SAM protein [Oscillospiraceae bacterium]